jgi:hypothetical protein
MHVLHKCDNPPCVNVEHLFLGTHQDNMDDRSAKNRQAQGEQHGRARLTDEEVDAIRESSASDVELARQYGVADSHINNIRHGRRRTQPTHKKGPG